MRSVTILTTFTSADEAYSLNRIVQDQIKMFSHFNYNIKVVVQEGFVPNDIYSNPAVELVTYPAIPVSNESVVDKTFDEDIEKLKTALKPVLENTEVMITHDLVYQPAAVKHNLAIRSLLKENPQVKTNFLHWIHSATEPAVLSGLRGGGSRYLDLIKTPFPRSFYIAFNSFSIPRIAKWFNIEESQVKYIPHPHDFLEGKHEMAQRIILDYNLLEKDVVCMYPCRLDLGKQPEVVIEIMAQVKETNRSICCLIADFHSTAGDKVDYRKKMQKMGLDLGLSETELVFLSEAKLGEERTEPRYEMPHQVINDLFDITNTFILPSRSETYSLVAQEAAAKRNFMVLNQDFPPFRSIYGDYPIYRQFSSNIDANSGMDGETNTNYSSKIDYYRDIAVYINYAQEQTRVLAEFNMIRKKRNLYYVFRHHIEPLLVVTPNNLNY